MLYGTFNESTNTFIGAPGTFPSWWAPQAPTPPTCKKTLTWFSRCGCTQESMTIHAENCIHPDHPQVVTLKDWGRATTEKCQRSECTLAISDDICDTCKFYAIFEPAKFNSFQLRALKDIKEYYQGRIALQNYALKKAIGKRHKAIDDAWHAYLAILSKYGVLELQPNLEIVEDGIIHNLIIKMERPGHILAGTYSEGVGDLKIEKFGYLRCVPDHFSFRISKVALENVIKPAASSPPSHDKSKCLVCLNFPAWCGATTGHGPAWCVAPGLGQNLKLVFKMI